ncbi:cell division cycle protein 20 homolog isoform X1 [Octopus bimaculoides]|uniref:cell division cycle protein 20 homolog isoform X1 n=1 Tax=Octopus bimaculoides TaxID=37653 RepID=UPI0022E01506|nr:cell division cycle protein 20 homolog isoform X1 [Octopus bimaculoides]
MKFLFFLNEEHKHIEYRVCFYQDRLPLKHKMQNRCIRQQNRKTLHLTTELLNHTTKQDGTQNLPMKRNVLQLPSACSWNCSPKSPHEFVFQSPSPSSLQGRSPQQISCNSTPRLKYSCTKSPSTPLDGDRFIPQRSSTDTDLAHYMIVKNENLQGEFKANYNEQLNTVLLNGKNPTSDKVLSFTCKKLKFGCCKSLENLYKKKANSPCKTVTREINQYSDRILDAPDLIDNFYCNLLDWSSRNVLCAALGPSCYLFDLEQDSIDELQNNDDRTEDNYVSCVSFSADGSFIGVGNNSGELQIWDTKTKKLLRTMYGARTSAHTLSWNANVLSCGTNDGTIYHHDIRLSDHVISTISAHTSIVCGLKWSGNGRYLASGGNDNIVNIWDFNRSVSIQPLLMLTHHRAAVKALSWCPWQDSILASGGGSKDKTIHIWSIPSGKCVNSKLTHSQITSLIWSNEHHEIVSGHGYSNYSLSFWKYPSFESVGELKGHIARILNLALSPDESTIASLSADETIRLWKCFNKTKKSKERLTHGMFSSIR